MRPTGTVRDIVVGATVRFRSRAYADGLPPARDDIRRGKIVYINRKNRYFRVAYDCNGQTMHTCFKF